MKRIIALLLAVALTAGLFSGCRKSGITALYFAAAGVAGSFDPQVADPGVVSVVVRNCFEGLVVPDETGKAQPAAAERWNVSADGKTYTFTLRQGAKWHVSDTVRGGLEGKLPENFQPDVTADDFVFALRRAADPNTGARDADMLKNITGAAAALNGEAPPESIGVTATGKYTLQITLNEPEPGFLEVLSQPLCMPCNETFFEATGGRYGLLMKYIISNGPYYMTRFEDTSFRLVKDDAYTGPHPAKTDVIWLYSNLTEDTVISRLAERELSAAYLSAAAAQNTKLRGTVLSADDMLRGVLFNCAEGALSNRNVRKAFLQAASVASVCNVFNQEPAAAVCPVSLSPKAAFSAGDNAAAALKLLEAGMKELEETELAFTLLCEEKYDAGLRYLLQTWQIAFGMKCTVSVQTVTEEELRSKVEAGEYEMAFYPVQASVYSPAEYFSQFSAAAKKPLGGLNDPAYDEAVNALRYCTEAALPQAQKNAEQLLADLAVFLPVWNEGTGLACVTGLTGVHLLSGSDRLYLYDVQE